MKIVRLIAMLLAAMLAAPLPAQQIHADARGF